MVNLLPTNVKSNYIYARHNSRLAKWARTLGLILFVTTLVSAGGYLYIDRSINMLNVQVSEAKIDLSDQKLEQTSARVEAISSNIGLISQVLSKQVLFSKLLKQIGNSMPSGTILDRLELNSEVSGGIDVSAIAKDYASATQVQVNLSDPEAKIFDKVDINSINCASSSQTAPDPKGLGAQYPCRISMRALFTKNNPYSLINDKGLKAPSTGAAQ